MDEIRIGIGIDQEGNVIGLNWDDLRPQLRVMAGQNLEFVIRRVKQVRSNRANNYYWGVVIKGVQEGMKIEGTKMKLENVPEWFLGLIDYENPKQVHKNLKEMFIEAVTIDEDTGEIISNEISTKRMSRKVFAEYVDSIIQFAAEELHVAIPQPGEQILLEFNK